MSKPWVRALTTAMTVGIMIMIFCFSMQPGEKSDETSGEIAQKVADWINPEWREMEEPERDEFYDHVQFVIRKCGHFTEFAMLGFSLRLCLESWFGRRKSLLLRSWGGSTLYAALDEMHQLGVEGRTGQYVDVLIDSSGALFGILVLTGILALCRKKKTEKTGLCSE